MAPNANPNMLTSSRHIQRKRKYHSDDGDFSDDDSGFSPKSSSPSADDDRRAHHNELERRRRDHIKDHFSSLKNAIPLLEGEKSSRALILKRAVDYIQVLQAQLKEAKMEIQDYKRHRNNNNNNETQFRLQNNSVFNGMLPPQPQQQQQQQLQHPQTQTILQNPHSIPSVSTAFMSLPSTTSVLQQQQHSGMVFPKVECLQSSSSTSPLLTVTPPNYVPNLPLQQPQQIATDSTKNALLSQLLQLIQTPTPASTLLPPLPVTTTLPQISLPQTEYSNNNNQQLFAFHERQLSSAVHL